MAGPTGEQDWYLSGVFAMSFINLNDTFGDFVDRAGKVPKVNVEEDALEPSDTHIDDHAARHESGGADEVTQITHKLNDHSARHEDGGADEVSHNNLALTEGDHHEPVFTRLNDTPSSYIGNAGKAHKVNATEDGLEASAASIDVHRDRHESGGDDEILHNDLAVNPDDHHAKTGDNDVYGLILSDTAANRPAAGVAERFFFATDEGVLYYDDGSAWHKAGTRDYLDLNQKPLFSLVCDQKPSGNGGGTFDDTAWIIRDLNTVVIDEIGISLFNNQITLPAGDYYIEVFAPACEVSRHMARVYNVTDGCVAFWCSSEFNSETYSTQTKSFGVSLLTLPYDRTYELQHHCEDGKASTGLGVDCGGGFVVDHETYSIVSIWKVK